MRLVQTAQYHAGLAQRGRIEAKFGKAKTKDGVRRCRHVGLRSFDFQAKLTVLVLNLKRMVQLLCGTQFYQGGAANATV